MTIVQKQITLNNTTFYYTCSDEGYVITDGVDSFVTAIDSTQKTYTETTKKIETTGENIINKVKTVSSLSSDIEYPSAKCVYNAVNTKLSNTATGTNALTVGGTASSATSCTNVGIASTAAGGYSAAFGYYSAANGARDTSLGYGARISGSTSDAIQIGCGTNENSKTLSIGFYNTNNYQLLDGTTGLIPDARLSSNISRSDHTHSTYALLSHGHGGTEITLTGYTKPSSASAIAATDTVTVALGKLEKALDGKQVSGSYASSSHTHTKSEITDFPTFSTGLTDTLGTITVTDYDKLVKNTATGTGSLSILGTLTSSAQAINIGKNSEATGAPSGIAIGYGAKVKTSNGIQLGFGTNDAFKGLQVYSYPLLNSTTGFIPDARLSSNIARTDVCTIQPYYSVTFSASSLSVPLTNSNSLYMITPTGNMTSAMTFSLSSSIVPNNAAYTFELCIKMTSSVYSIIFPSSSTLTWLGGEDPDMSETGTYFFAFRTLDKGSTWLGNLQGKW